MLLCKKTIDIYLKELGVDSEISRIIPLNNSRNFCFKVYLKQKDGFFLKQVKNNSTEAIKLFQRESIFYTFIEKSNVVSIKRLLPNFLGYDSIFNIAIWNLISNGISLKKYLLKKEITPLITSKIGNILKEYSEIQLSKEMPFEPLHNPFFIDISQSPNNFKDNIFIEYIFNNEILIEGYEKVKKMWCINSIVHMDVKFENFLIHDKTSNIYLTDWEGASLGDINWDIACCLRNITLEILSKEKIVLINGYTPLNPILDNNILMRSLKAFLQSCEMEFDETRKIKLICFFAVAIIDKLLEVVGSENHLNKRDTQLILLAESLLKTPSLYFKIWD